VLHCVTIASINGAVIYTYRRIETDKNEVLRRYWSWSKLAWNLHIYLRILKYCLLLF